MDYEKKYNEALERAKKLSVDGYLDAIAVEEIFPPEESEDERIRTWLVDYFSSIKKTVWLYRDITCEQILAYLEKQKEPTKEELYAEAGTTENEYIANTMKMVRAMREKQKEQKPLETPSPSVIYTEQGDVLAEQKPASTEDMPYITDEHFYEREPADSFKYKLAEYMTRCCTKKKGPYGYEYGISAESILKMAKEELLKRGVVQKPAEWSEEDADILNCCISSIEEAKENRYAYKETDGDTSYDREIAWLKSIRPCSSWKPSEEQMKQLHYALTPGSAFDCDILNELYIQLKKLK